MPKIESSPMQDPRGFLEPEEIRTLIRSADFGYKGRRNKLLIRVLWETGARVSEIVGKKVCEKCELPAHYYKYVVKGEEVVSPHCTCNEPNYAHRQPLIPDRLISEDATMILFTRKRKKPSQRMVEVTQKLMDDLISYIRGKGMGPNDRVFSITQRRVRQIVRKAAKRASMERVGDSFLHPHHFRHSHAIAYTRSDNSLDGLKKLQRRFQHANIMTTAHYLQYSREGEQKKIEEIFG